VGEDEHRFLALADLEFGHGVEVLAAGGHRGPQRHLVRPGHRAQVAVVVARHPGHGAAVVEAQHQLHPHGDPPAHAADDADQVGAAVARRHEVDQRDGAAVRRFHDRLQHQRIPRYCRSVRSGTTSRGAMRQRPCSGAPSRAAKHAGLSKRGQQSQSTEPSRDTSAAVSQSPRRA
jgi:hypothetical protein